MMRRLIVPGVPSLFPPVPGTDHSAFPIRPLRSRERERGTGTSTSLRRWDPRKTGAQPPDWSGVVSAQGIALRCTPVRSSAEPTLLKRSANEFRMVSYRNEPARCGKTGARIGYTPRLPAQTQSTDGVTTRKIPPADSRRITQT